MGQFKPMVKMYTTEPSVELKLKKGGHVKTSKMKVKEHDGHKMMDGGVPPAPMGMPARGGVPTAAAPMKPSLAMRRRAMKGLPAAAGPAAPVGMAGRVLKKGGKAEGGESMAEHMKEMREMKKTEKELKKHESLPASKAHKGLKKGGSCYATGGVAMGQAGFKKGGKVKMAEGGVPKSGILPVAESERGGGKYRTTKMDTAEYTGKTSGKTGEVKNANGGGYKKGGKACYKEGGSVMNYVDGNVVGTPAGKTNTTTGGVKLSNAGGYKKGGSAKKAADGGKKGNPIVKARARRYADGGEVIGSAIAGPVSDGFTPMPQLGSLTPDMNAPQKQIVTGGQEPRQVELMKQMLEKEANGPRYSNYGPGSGLAPSVQSQRQDQMRNMFQGFLNSPMGRAFANSPMGRKFAGMSGNVTGLPKPAPTGRVNLPNVAPTGRIYSEDQDGANQTGRAMTAKYATGGSVQDDGRAVKMPARRVPTPVSINQLSGTYKKGGKVKK